MIPVTLAPAPDRFARDPLTNKPLDPAGESKPLNAFWRRRLLAGDVVELPGAGPVAVAVIEPAPGDFVPAPPVSAEVPVLAPAEAPPDADGSPSGQSAEPSRVKTQARPIRRAARTTEH